MGRDELIMHIDDKMNEALGEYYTKLSEGGEYDYNGDITPEESIVWDDIVCIIANLFERLAEHNKVKVVK